MYSEDSKKKLFYLVSDIFAMIITYWTLAMFHYYDFFSSNFFSLAFILLITVVGIMSDEYSNISNRGYLKEAKAVLIYGLKVMVLFSFVLIIGKFRFLSDISTISYFFLIKTYILSISLVYLGRILVKHLLKDQKPNKRRVLLVTNFADERKLEKFLESENYDIVAYCSNLKYFNLQLPVISGLDEIRDFIANNQVDEIFVDTDAKADYIDTMRYLKMLGIPITINISSYSDYYLGNSVIKKVSDFTFVTSAITIVKFRQVVLKRLMDISIASVGLILTVIVALIIRPIVKQQSPGPLLFKQKRVGKNGRVFEMYKFRSMYMDAEERKKELLQKNELETNLMFKMDNDPRIFPFGQQLRDWSIDELPQFLNVLKGDMSVVGTRPPTLEEYQRYELQHFKRLATKPGITGLWQVSGRSNIKNFEEVVSLDIQYIQNWSIGQDIKILLKTFLVVIKREGSK